MKKLAIVLLLTILSLPIMVSAIVWGSGSFDEVNVYFFTSKDCKDCDKKIKYVEGLKKDNARIIINEIDIDNDKELVKEVRNSLKIKNKKLPLVIVGSNYFIGNSDDLNEAIKAYLNKDNNCDVVETIKGKGDVSKCLKTNEGIYEQPKSFSMMKVVLILIIVIAIAGCILFIVNNKKKNIIKA